MAILTSTEWLQYLESVANVTVPAVGQVLLNMTYPMIVAEVEDYIGKKIEQATVTEFQPGVNPPGPGDTESLIQGWDKAGSQVMAEMRGNRNVLTLRKTPVRSITFVYENPSAWQGGDANGSFPTALAATEYYLDQEEPGLSKTGHLYRVSGSAWSQIPRTVKIVYVAGYTADEINTDYSYLKLALLEALAEEYKRSVAATNAAADGGVTQSVSIEDFSTSMQPLINADTTKYSLPPYIRKKLDRCVNWAKYYRG